MRQTEKQLGQFLTPTSIAALACAAAVSEGATDVIDPACGDGEMLWAAHARATALGTNPEIRGIEIHPLLAQLAGLPGPSWRAGTGQSSVRVECADAFASSAGLVGSEGALRARFSAVIGNPPYVRYQSLAALITWMPTALVQAIQAEFPALGGSRIVDKLIRCCLVSHLLPPLERTVNGYRQFVRDGHQLLRSPDRCSLDLDKYWASIVAGYSGLADLSVPMWLLAWWLARPSGRIAYVTTHSLQNREYGRLLRYFMLRFLRPLMVVEQEGNAWFNNAQVAASLMVFAVRDRADCLTPLTDRSSVELVTRVRMRRQFDLSDVATLRALAGSSDSHSLDESASALLTQMQLGEESEAWTSDTLDTRELSRSLLEQERSSGGATSSLICRLEQFRSQVAYSAPRGPLLPASLRQLIEPSNANLVLLQNEGIAVHQGLRTGANEFFYVRLVPDHDLEALFGPNSSLVTTAVRLGNAEPRALASLRAAKVDVDGLEEPSVIVQVSGALENARLVLPRRYLRPVVRYQRELTRFGVHSAGLEDMAVCVMDEARASDLSEPHVPLFARKMSPTLVRLLDKAESVTMTTAGGARRIPELSAVRTNESLTRRPPTFWYTLPLKSRHFGAVFIPRVNGREVPAFLNDLEEPALIDANFTTLICEGSRYSPFALLSLMNSKWIRAIAETNGTPMGGGALKLEAAQIRMTPIPELDDASIRGLEALGRELRSCRRGDGQSLLWKTDQILADAIVDNGRAASLTSALSSFIDQAARTRERHGSPI